MRLRRLGLLGMAVSFARSEQGRRLIQSARQRVDTPANRAKLREGLNRSRTSPGR